VMLPSGLVGERTKPWPTMSFEMAKIGMVFVACCPARTASLPAQMIASTLALTSAAACSASWLTRSSYPWVSTKRFCPSTNPCRRSSS
jgi:hypothetical protein